MTITRLFTKTFDEVMKAKGFKRKNRLYFKLVGEILQGVVIKATNPFEICFCAAPYWIPRNLTDMFPLHKGYWAESNGFRINSTDFYRKDAEVYNSYYMNECLKLAENYVFPYFESITDLDSYIDAMTDFWAGRSPEEKRLRLIRFFVDSEDGLRDSEITVFWRMLEQGTQYALLYKAYLNHSFEQTYEELKTILSHNVLVSPRDRLDEYYGGAFINQMEKGDYLWIETFRQERKKQIEERMREELGLSVL